ncbi:MAG: hypothetical protein DWQ01_08335 [Planctomycetota bacterium]|nr:MAG: hypothetical protein DWQ01_08335 [Planctomycetota bacterium]
MSKLQVVDPSEKTRVPFLRGILTRSLQDAGMPFEAAYEMASRIRADLAQRQEITTEELRATVAEGLEEAVRKRYEQTGGSQGEIWVQDADQEPVPYSRGRHRQGLEASALSPENAAIIAANVYAHLTQEGIVEIGRRQLMEITYRQILQDFGQTPARHYLVWEQFHHSDRPLLVFFGGTPGCGKSSVATRVANLLDIVRSQSTDMLREVMRILVPEKLLPALHTSSFQAFQRLPAWEHQVQDEQALLAHGYLNQTELVSVACEAAIERALQERVSMVLEGVHVHPTLLSRLPQDGDAILVPMMLAVLKPSLLHQRILGRGRSSPDRRASRYLKNFQDIWELQSFLLSEADQANIPIVANELMEVTVQRSMSLIMQSLSQHFSGNPEEVFS